MKNKIFLLIFLISNGVVVSCTNPHKLTKKYMNHVYQDLKNELHEAKTYSFNDTVKVVFPSKILFDFGEAKISQSAYPSFVKFARLLNEYKNTNLLIVGHTDSIGSNEQNKFLSLERADSARQILFKNKVDISRMDVWGMGFNDPVASNATEEGRQQNRRVDFILLYKTKKN